MIKVANLHPLLLHVFFFQHGSNLISVDSVCNKARFFLLVDLQDFFSDLGTGGREKKSSENDEFTAHFQSFFFHFQSYSFFFFLNIS